MRSFLSRLIRFDKGTPFRGFIRFRLRDLGAKLAFQISDVFEILVLFTLLLRVQVVTRKVEDSVKFLCPLHPRTIKLAPLVQNASGAVGRMLQIHFD